MVSLTFVEDVPVATLVNPHVRILHLSSAREIELKWRKCGGNVEENWSQMEEMWRRIGVKWRNVVKNGVNWREIATF